MPEISQTELDRLVAARAERDRLRRLINSPHVFSFLRGTQLEVAHQVERWGEAHDHAKMPADWFWLLAYLAGKALAAHIAGDADKAKHHCISSAGVLAKWHMAIDGGEGGSRATASDMKQFVTSTFGGDLVETPHELRNASEVSLESADPDSGVGFFYP
jgi:hypothetical protein